MSPALSGLMGFNCQICSCRMWPTVSACNMCCAGQFAWTGQTETAGQANSCAPSRPSSFTSERKPQLDALGNSVPDMDVAVDIGPPEEVQPVLVSQCMVFTAAAQDEKPGRTCTERTRRVSTTGAERQSAASGLFMCRVSPSKRGPGHCCSAINHGVAVMMSGSHSAALMPRCEHAYTHLWIMTAATSAVASTYGSGFHVKTLLYTAAGSGSGSAADAFLGRQPLSGPQSAWQWLAGPDAAAQCSFAAVEQLQTPLQDNSGTLFRGLRVRMAMATGTAVVDLADGHHAEQQHMLPGRLPVSSVCVECPLNS